ncbi:MAG: ShlB/FhaC/HecB family hemolysin secretion/activation protein [Planctomycetota bacterium]
MASSTGGQKRTGGALRRVLAAGLACAVIVAWGGATAAEGEPAFTVTEVQLSYGGADDPEHALHGGHPALPSASEVAQAPLTLGKVADGYVAPREGAETVETTVAGIAGLPMHQFYASALRSLSQQLLRFFRQRGIAGVFVAPHPEDILEERSVGEDGKVKVELEDRRAEGKTSLRMVVWVGVVTEVRTLASGERVPTDERVNNPAHQRIKERSPVQPDGDNLVRQEELERYIYWLSRHPGRRVDLALSSGQRPGGVVLDYLVTENKPWYAYAQASNTGTENTADWRERVGFVHNQLTGRDDILSLDYVTSGFDEAHAVLASYSAPFFGVPRLRWRVYGSYSEYTASDVGLANQEFEGETWTAGAELIATVFQYERFFVDLVGGARWEDFEVENELLDITGEEDLCIPYVGLRFERLTETASTWGSVTLECVASNPSSGELYELGRLDVDDRWQILKFDASQSFYLEPLLCPAAWEDPGTPRSSTLAHELFFSVRGQKSLGDRVIPQHQHVAGGLYTVRGYPESVVAGDSVAVFTAEYRFHVPRILAPREPKMMPVLNQPFKFAPQQVYGRPDWDLIARVFYDAARVTNVHKAVFEDDYTLSGTGVGLEFRFKRYLSVRCDYAVTLDTVQTTTRDVEAGHNRIHTVVTITF